MSGKPSPAGARRALALIDEIAASGRVIMELRQSVEILKTAEQDYARLSHELHGLLRTMDVEDVGNTGYERRTAWLLMEVVRLARGES